MNIFDEVDDEDEGAVGAGGVGDGLHFRRVQEFVAAGCFDPVDGESWEVDTSLHF